MNKKQTILVVDDDPHMLRGTARVLSNEGYGVIQARSAAAGVKAARERQPDLILLDVVLPDGDGCEICRQLKKEPVTAGIFIVLISALKVETDDRCQGLVIGADDYIVRPIANRELLARVRAMLRLKTAENALRKHEKLLTAIVNGISNRLYMLDTDLRIQWSNQSTDAALGKDQQQIIGKPCHDIRMHASSPCDNCPAEKALLTRQPNQAIIHFADGAISQCNAVPLFDEHGHIFGILRTDIDVTRYKKAEDELIHNRDQLTAMVDQRTIQLKHEIIERERFEKEMHDHIANFNAAFYSAPIVLMQVDSDGRVEKISDSGAALIGRPESDLVGILCGDALNCINARNMQDCGGQAYCRACPIRNCIDVTLQTGKALKQVEGKLTVWRNGAEETLYFLISTALLKLQNEPKVLLLLMDVTAQKTAEKRIRESDQAYKVLFHDSPVALYVQDFAEVDALVKTLRQSGVSRLKNYLATHPAEVNRLAGAVRIVEINQAAVDLYKADSPNQFQHDFKQILVPDDNQHFIDQVVAFTSGHDHYEGPARNYDLQGNPLEILLRKAVINRETNGLSKVLASVTDVTELHGAHRENAKLEKRLHLAQKMESIGNLASGIAHDFNNILFPIVGLSELMLEDLAPGSQEYNNAQEILNAGNRGSDLVRQILSFSRQGEEKAVPVQLASIFNEVFSLSRSTIPANIELSHDIDKGIGLIQADPTRLHQIIMNLITNAYHAVETDGGAISIRLREVALDCPDEIGLSVKPGRYAMLSVADTGCGIEEAILSKIFDPYFTTKAQGKGTGLGLAVVYGIVRQYQGDIQVYSEVGKGTCVNIYLPVIDHDEFAASAVQAGPQPAGTERILLVDDETANVALEKQMLNRLGYDVVEATRSTDALKAFQTDPQFFDLVITDLTMPDMTGDRLASAILSIRPDMPIIICTGFSEKAVQNNFSQIGIKGVLMKPMVKADLANIVRNVLDAGTTGQTEMQGEVKQTR